MSMTKDELIAAIRQTALTEQEYMEVFQATMEAMLGSALVGMGMDMTTGQAPASTGVMPTAGRWVPAPMCAPGFHDNERSGWRGIDTGSHEHWVV